MKKKKKNPLWRASLFQPLLNFKELILESDMNCKISRRKNAIIAHVFTLQELKQQRSYFAMELHHFLHPVENPY